jgi:nitroreductase/NAD-dependent dihydropyrimidine dehydrogenase PreA subunit
MAQITVDAQACVNCGDCVDVCVAAQVYEMAGGTARAVRPDACWACGQCVAVCPTDAIDHDVFPLEDCPILEADQLPSKEALTAAFRARRSTRTFLPKPVPREIVRELVSLGRWAPTASNSQAFDWIAFDNRARIAEFSRATVDGMLRFARIAESPFARPFLHLVARKEAIQKLRKGAPALRRMSERLTDGGDPIFHHAPVVLIGHGPRGNTFGRDDAIYATYNVMLYAERFDLATCQIGFFQAIAERSSRLRQSIGAPEGRAPQVAVALGYPRHTFRRLPQRREPDLTWNPR